MVGIMDGAKPLLRAYSIASPVGDEEIELYSIKVQDGPRTSRLQHIKVGDKILLGKKPTGTLVADALKPGKRLFLFSTGTGVAPFASVIRDPEIYDQFDQVILTHTCRDLCDLEYSKQLVDSLPDDPLVGELVGDKLMRFATTTREPSDHMGRITEILTNGEFFKATGLPPLNPETDRVMICGSMAMLQDVAAIVEAAGFVEGANNKPGDYVVEKAFVC